MSFPVWLHRNHFILRSSSKSRFRDTVEGGRRRNPDGDGARGLLNAGCKFVLNFYGEEQNYPVKFGPRLSYALNIG